MKFLFLFVLILVSCTSNNTTPEGALKNYIELRFSNNVSIEKLAQHFTGPIFEKLSTLSEEDIKKFFAADGLKMKKFEILSKSCESEKCFLTYILSYHTTIAETEDYSSKVKKVVELWKDGNDWKIATINNIKTFHKSNQAINALEL